MHTIKKIALVGTIAATVLFFRSTHAATMSFVSNVNHASIGDTIDVSVRIDTQGQTVNVAQGTIDYPASILQVSRVDHSNSIFNIWAQEPSVNTSTGEISFLGGGTNSFSGTSLYVLDITFVVRGTGTAALDFKNAGVTAGDGTGANVLESTNPFSLSVAGSSGAGSVPVAVGSTNGGTTTSSTSPESITRAPAVVSGLPETPVLRVPLYPDQTRWYDQLGEVVLFWNLPADVSQVITRLSHVPDLVAGQKQQQLLTGQSFGTLSDGVWYLRAQFMNNVGISKPSYYKISIDTAPPLPFDIKIDNATSDNPTPQITYRTNDSFSGIDHYEVVVDGGDPFITTSTSITLSPQAPGLHTVIVNAIDLAGNVTKSSLAFNVLPLALPQVVFVTPSASEGEPLFVSGTALPRSNVRVYIKNGEQKSVFESTTTANDAGDWSVVVSQDIPQGNYSVSVIASDARGATSFPTKAMPITVRDRVIFSIGAIGFSWFELFLLILLFAVAIAAIVAWSLFSRAEYRRAFRIVAGRDVKQLTDILTLQLEEAKKRHEDTNEETAIASKMELGDFLDRAQDTVVRMKKYLGKEVEDLK